MTNASAGILLYRREKTEVLVLLTHFGGPFWRRKDMGAWAIPKGELAPGEDAETAARREFAEELGSEAKGALQSLGEIRQKGGKRVEVFALEGDFDVTQLRSNQFVMEWPPHSGRQQSFPEVDRAEWFSLPVAAQKILASQRPFLDRLQQQLAQRS